MDDKEKLQKIIDLIEQSDLDRTIKDILIRDIQNEGLTDFLREQIRVFCLEGIKRLDSQMEEAKAALDESPAEAMVSGSASVENSESNESSANTENPA